MATKLGGSGKGRQTPKPAAGSGGDGRALSPKDNQQAVLEAEKVQLLSYIGRLQEQGKKVEARRAELKIETDTMTELFRLAKAAGFSRKDLQGLLDDLSSRTRDLVADEQRRRRYREHLGLPTGETQMEFFNSGSPAEVREEAAARADGYMAGLRGAEPTPPTEIPARFTQVWIAGWHDGQKVIGDAYIAAAEAAKAKPPAPPANANEEPEDLEAKAKAEAKKLQESGWAQKNPDAPDAAEQEIARLSAEQAADDASTTVDDFEASEEELAQQAFRVTAPDDATAPTEPEAV